MFILRPIFKVLLQLGVIIFSYSEVRGHNDLDVAPMRSGKVMHGAAERRQLKYRGNCACGYAKNCAAQSSSTGTIQNDYPMIAALAIIRNNTSYWVCQGTIIGPKYILTTNHCTPFMLEMWAVVGPYTCTAKGTGGYYALPIIHEDIRYIPEATLYKTNDYLRKDPKVFNKKKSSNIPFIYVLDKTIVFSNEVRPACIPIDVEPACGSEVYMIGWENRPKTLSTLEKSVLRVLPDTECIEKNGHISNLLCVLADNNLKTTADAVGLYHTGHDGRIYLVGLIDSDSPRNGSVISALGTFPLKNWIIKETWHLVD